MSQPLVQSTCHSEKTNIPVYLSQHQSLQYNCIYSENLLFMVSNTELITDQGVHGGLHVHKLGKCGRVGGLWCYYQDKWRNLEAKLY